MTDPTNLVERLQSAYSTVFERSLAREAATALASLADELENERLKVAGCSTAAIGYWKEGDSLHPNYECAAIHDVARLYAKVASLADELRLARERVAELEKSVLGECEECGQTIITPLHHLPSVEKDAARYRWLRDAARVSGDGTVSVGGGVLLADPPSTSPMSDAEQLDAAIDQAMKGSK